MTELESFFLGLVKAGKLTVDKQGVVINTKTKNQIGCFNKKKKWIVVAQTDATGRLQYILLHRLVWLIHNGPVPDKALVVPKDGNFLNASLDNLKLSSKDIRDQIKAELKEQAKKFLFTKSVKPERVFIRVPRPKKIKPLPVKKDKSERSNVTLNRDQVTQIRREYGSGVNTKTLAIRYGVGLNTIRMAADGTTWSDCEEPTVTATQRRVVVEKLRAEKKAVDKKAAQEKRMSEARKLVAGRVMRAKERSATMCEYVPVEKKSRVQKTVVPKVNVKNTGRPETKAEPKVYRGRLSMLNNW